VRLLMSGPQNLLNSLESSWGLLFGAFRASADGILGTEKIHSTFG